MPFPLIPFALTAGNFGYHSLKHVFRKTPKPLHAMAYGIGYAGGTNIGYNMFNEFLTSHLRQPHKYVGRPQYVNRL